MTLDQLDQELAAWQQAALAIVNNVYGLYEHPTHRTLAAHRPEAPCRTSGLTKHRADAAVAAVTDLLELSLCLDGVVKRAAELRAALPLLFQRERLDEIEQLLTGPSIKIPEVETPLAQRGLLSRAAEARSLSPAQLLEIMLPAFDAAKSTILSVDDAWTKLPGTLEELHAEAMELDAGAGAEGLSAEFDVPGILRALDSARTALIEDPLGTASETESKIRPRIALLQDRLDRRRAERRSLSDDLRAAESAMTDLDALRERAGAIEAESLLKVEAPLQPSAPPAPPPEHAAALRAWHARLHVAVQDGECRSARIGLEKWLHAVEETRAACEEALRVHEQALHSRRELRGRLEAMKAKAEARGFAEDAALGALERDAAACFLRRPTPMLEAERLVAAYQRRLASRELPPR